MKKYTLRIAFLAVAALSGCAVVPAYGPAYYEPAPHYSARPYYGPPAVVVPAPIFIPRYGYRGGRYWR